MIYKHIYILCVHILLLHMMFVPHRWVWYLHTTVKMLWLTCTPNHHQQRKHFKKWIFHATGFKALETGRLKDMLHVCISQEESTYSYHPAVLVWRRNSLGSFLLVVVMSAAATKMKKPDGGKLALYIRYVMEVWGTTVWYQVPYHTGEGTGIGHWALGIIVSSWSFHPPSSSCLTSWSIVVRVWYVHSLR